MMFNKHRIQYEINDLYDGYFAYLLIPSVTLIGLFLFINYGVFTSAIPTGVSSTFLFLSIMVFMMWVFLCSSDPGRVITPAGYLSRIEGLDRRCREHYRESVEGKRIVNQSLCATCEIERPNRCKHCSKCNVCVMRMDHHCTIIVWIS